MSQLQYEIVEDPTRTKYLEDRWSNRLIDKLSEVEGSILVQTTYNDMLVMLEYINDEQLAASFLYFALYNSEFMLRTFTERGLQFATDNVRVSNPQFSQLAPFQALSSPADFTIYNTALNNNSKYLNQFSNELYFSIKDIINKKLGIQDTRNVISLIFNNAKNRANMHARTSTMETFNNSAWDRYKTLGVKKYIFLTHKGACTDDKTLRDGTIIVGGCTALHGKEFPINDRKHIPPIHPLGRCTILPKI